MFQLAGRAIVGAALAVLFLVVYPLSPIVLHPYAAVVQPALNRLVTPDAISGGALAAAEAESDPAQIRRIPPYLATGSLAAYGSVSMPELVSFASDLKALVGTRNTYIELVPSVYTGLIYFTADLRQGPYQYDKETMILNGLMLRDWFAYFKAHVNDFECLITQATTSTEAAIFLEAFPNATIVERRLGTHLFYVLLRDAHAAEGGHDVLRELKQ